MGALSAAAAIGALALAVSQFRPRKSVRRRPVREPMMFDPPAAATPDVGPAPPGLAPAPFEPPAPLAPLAVERFELTPPRPARRIDLALMSRKAPERLRVPVDLARGRILELNLPLLIANAGEAELGQVVLLITLPNEITYGASLERLTRQEVAGLPGSVVRYQLSEAQTQIGVDLPRLAPGATASLPIPISIKHAADAAYPIVIAAFAPGMAPVERRYELELVDPQGAPDQLSSAEAWICRPDEGSRQRDPHLPLDRISSTQFAIAELAAAGRIAPEPAFEPLTL